jgi:hypothetical protein
MNQLTTTPDHKPELSPVAATVYLVFKKAVKYSLYLALCYFAYEGFMHWE